MEESKLFEIRTNPNGTFSDIHLSVSRLTPIWENLREGAPYVLPIGLFGPNRLDEVRALLAQPLQDVPILFMDGGGSDSSVGISPQIFKTLTNIQYYHPDIARVTRPIFEQQSNIIIGNFSPNQYINSIRSQLRRLPNPSKLLEEFDQYIARLSVAFDEKPTIISIEQPRNQLSVVALSTWLSKPRPLPAIVLTTNPVRDKGMRILDSQVIDLNQVLVSIENIFHLGKDDVDNAHRIWSLSRRRMLRSTSSSPHVITVPSARELCEIVSETFQSKIIENSRPLQRPAPLKFEYGTHGISVSNGHHAHDSDVVIKAAAISLKEMCERLSTNAGMHNHLSHFANSMQRNSNLLQTIISGSYDDGHIISLGLEFNALQWQIDAVKDQLTSTSIAEAAGLFSNAHLFLSRFMGWKAFSGRLDTESGSSSDELKVARDLLSSAKSTESLLDTDASSRVGVMLQALPKANSPPPLIDGVIGSGENLSAAIVNGISQVMVGSERATSATKLTDQEIALIQFGIKHANDLTKIATLKERSWAGWGAELLREAKKNYKL